MNNQASVFDFNDSPVRVYGTPDSPLFVAADVCRLLNLEQVTRALDGIDDDEKGVTIGKTPGGDQKLNVITESGLYARVFKSRKPQAKAFRKWVTGEVLPAIRQTGRYAAPAPGAAPATPVEEKCPVLSLVALGCATGEGLLAGTVSVERSEQVLALLVECRRLLAAGGTSGAPSAAAWQGEAASRAESSMARVLVETANLLPGSSVLRMPSLYSAAEAAGYAADLMRDGVLPPGAAKVVGRRLQNLFGRLMTDGKGRRFSVWKKRTKLGQTYLFRFEPLAGAAAGVAMGLGGRN